ncbi:MFS transporter, partial [Nocardia cyriacigeorgica]|nr:MFS transporter [Nocardia cyriacigeorgica]
VPESRDPQADTRLDIPGAFVVAVALAALTLGLIDAMPWLVVAGAVLLGVFVVIEMRSDHPLVPPTLFASRVFTAANLVTLVVYAALGGVFFLLVLELQVVAGYSPLQAGMATVPVTILMLLLS